MENRYKKNVKKEKTVSKGYLITIASFSCSIWTTPKSFMLRMASARLFLRLATK